MQVEIWTRLAMVNLIGTDISRKSALTNCINKSALKEFREYWINFQCLSNGKEIKIESR